jgi:hypothetical protein
MEPVGRRLFFKQAGAAAALAGAAAVVPLGFGGTAGAATVEEAPLTASEDLANDEHLMAHVRNARTGEISLFIGTKEIVLHDRKIAARLVRASRRAHL